MMGRSRALVLILILSISLVLLLSCTKTEYKVADLRIQPFVRTDSTMGLSLYVLPDVSASDKGDLGLIQMVVKSPDGNLSWSFQASRVTYDRLVYYGSSDICMPKGLDLPKGRWSVDVAFKDGSTQNLEFEVAYTQAPSALDAYSKSGSDGVWFDEASNLTVVP